MSQPPYGGPPNQNPPYPNQPGPYNQPAPYPQPAYGPPGPYAGPPPNPYGGPPQYGPGSMAPQQGPGFGWGPTFGPPPGPGGSGFQPGWQPQRPRKKPKGPLIAILGIVGVVVVGAWMFGVIKKNADNVATPPVSSGRYTPEPVESPTSAPTEQPTSTASPSQGKSDAEIAAKNALYAVGQMATVNCKEPSVRPTTARNAAAYWAAIKPCLDKSWAPLVAKAGYTFKAPTMMYWQGTSVNNPCGSGPVSVPFYCSANHVMYMKVDVFVKSYNEYPDAEAKAYARMWYSRSIAHEYGHSVQYMTGILQAASAMRYEQPDEAGQMRMTRRMELQANCFAGVFLAANKRSYPINGLMLSVWTKYVVTAGDKPEEGDHGSVASQARFMGKSFTTANPASCNTFAASAANVS